MLDQLTAGQILGAFTGGNGYVLLINLLFLLAGFAYNAYVEINREKISLKDYIQNYKGRSIASAVALVTSFFGMTLLTPEASVLAFFTIGFTGDAILNKAPKRSELMSSLTGTTNA